MALPGFQEAAFTWNKVTRRLYRRGTGPGVVVLHEIPGITPQVARFAERVAAAGLTAVLPVLFGTPGKPLSAGYALGQLVRVCLGREFACLAARRSSPVADWLRALCRQVHGECGGPGVGVVGMCLTGGLALSLVADPAVLAPVLSQPSLPLLACTRARKEALAVSPEELAAVRERCAAGLRVLGLRFTGDWLCPAERFRRLRHELGPAFEGVEIDSSRGNPHGIGRRAHAVLTNDFVDQDGHPTRRALDRVLALFRERLLPGGSVGEGVGGPS
jgi:dienelactone hydrolase